MDIIITLILIIISIWSYYKYRDILCPAFIHNIFWIISLMFIRKFEAFNTIELMAYITIIAGSILFQIGFYTSKKININKNFSRTIEEYDLDFINIKKLCILILLISIPALYEYTTKIYVSDLSLYAILRNSDDNLNLPFFFDHYRRFIELLSVALLITYWKLSILRRKRYRSYIYLIFFLAVLCVASVPSRNSILFYLLPVLISYCQIARLSNKKIIFLLCSFFSIFMILYSIISFSKFYYIYESSNNTLGILFDEILVYLSGGIVAFGNNVSEHSFDLMGKNSLRLLFSIYDYIFGTSYAVKLVSEFTVIGSTSTTNVYTFYDFYIRDFGVLYALIAQFLLAFIHGKVYYKSKHNNLYCIYLNAFLCYPLIMQFFNDQYLSLFSTWIQILLVGLLVYKSKLFIIKRNYKN